MPEFIGGPLDGCNFEPSRIMISAINLGSGRARIVVPASPSECERLIAEGKHARDVASTIQGQLAAYDRERRADGEVRFCFATDDDEASQPEPLGDLAQEERLAAIASRLCKQAESATLTPTSRVDLVYHFEGGMPSRRETIIEAVVGESTAAEHLAEMVLRPAILQAIRGNVRASPPGVRDVALEVMERGFNDE